MKKGILKIVSTFTSQPIEEYIEYWNKKLKLNYKIKFGAYNQVFQEILPGHRKTSKFKVAVEVFLIRIEDWGNGDKGCIIDKNLIDESLTNFSGIINEKIDDVLRIICIMPHSSKFNSKTKYFRMIEKKFQSCFKKKKNLIYIPSEEFIKKCRVYHDEYSDQQSNIPYVPAMYANAATIISRKIFVCGRKPLKVIVLDCDNTLWSGVCAEDGSLGVKISKEHEYLQKFFLNLYKKGVLLCVCSKNNEQDVFDVFLKNKKMVLQQEHFVCMKINWDSKYKNILLISKELNLNLSDFAFVDDNPVECAEVMSNLPQVLVINLPMESNKFPNFLENIWHFDVFDNLTAEDKERTTLYKAEMERTKFKSNFKNLREFICQLGLKINLMDYESKYLSRLSQLTYRINQFNFTAKKYSEKDLADLVDKKYGVKFAEVSDKFGNYGIVGMIVFREHQGVLEIDSFLLSCRALGRGVEFNLLAEIGKIAKEKHIKLIKLFFRFTERNGEVVNFLNKIGVTKISKKNTFFELDSNLVAQLSFERYLRSLEKAS